MKYITLILLFFVFSCGNDTVPKPKNLIDEDKMVDIYYDLSLLEAINNQIPIGQKIYIGKSNDYIYKKYEIDSLQFVQNNLYYASDIDNYKKMYGKVKDRLTEEDEKINPSVVNDSIVKPL